MKKPLTILFSLILIFFIQLPSFSSIDTSNFKIESGACIVIEPSTNKIIYEKNSKEKMYPASTTKIITALVAIENCKLTDVAIVSESAIKSISPEYATVYLNKGEELTIEQLLNILLIPSGNIAGNILAEHISGSPENFVNLMNKKAKELGCINTHFTNTYGLHDDNHYTCAYDLYLIAKEAMKHDVFKSIVKQTSYKLGPTNKYSKDDRVFYTTNELIKPNKSKTANNYYYENAIGIKTGYTSQAKDCLVSAAIKDGIEIYCVILGAGKSSTGLNLRYTETKKLYEFVFNNYSFRTLREQNSTFKQVEIKGATNKTKTLNVLVENNITAFVDKDNLFNTIAPEANIYENLKAPISKGEIIGEISYTIDNITYKSNLIAGNDVEKSNITSIIGISILIIIILLFLKKILFKKKHKKKKNIKYKNYRK